MAEAEEKEHTPTIEDILYLSSSMEETPIRAVVCLKRKEDVKRFEETEECFILDFDPFDDSIDLSKLSLENKNNNDDDDDDGGGGGGGGGDTPDISIVAEKGQVACRDYPHARHLCGKFPFKTTPHESFCEKCYCYVCDSVAPCKYWNDSYDAHCDADSDWEEERNAVKRLAEEEAL